MKNSVRPWNDVCITDVMEADVIFEEETHRQAVVNIIKLKGIKLIS